MIIAYLIWKGSYNSDFVGWQVFVIIAYLIWKGSYNRYRSIEIRLYIIAYLIWKGSYNKEPSRVRLMDCFALLAMTIEQRAMLYNDAKNGEGIIC